MGDASLPLFQFVLIPLTCIVKLLLYSTVLVQCKLGHKEVESRQTWLHKRLHQGHVSIYTGLLYEDSTQSCTLGIVDSTILFNGIQLNEPTVYKRTH